MPSKQELEIAALKEQLAVLKAKSNRAISFKVSEKGGLSVYGLGRFPVTLYKEQWVKLNDAMPQVMDFLKDNEDTLKSKD